MKKVLSFISLLLVCSLLLPLYAAATVDVYSVYPQLRLFYGEGLEDYQQLNAGLTLIPSGSEQLNLSYKPAVEGHEDYDYDSAQGIVIPFPADGNNSVYDGRTYVTTFNVQLWLNEQDNMSPSDLQSYPLIANCESVYLCDEYDSGEISGVEELPLVSSSDVTVKKFSNNDLTVFYSTNYTALNSNPNTVVDQDYYGVLNIDVSCVYTVTSSLPESVFLAIDFSGFFIPYMTYQIQIEPASTLEFVDSSIDDVVSSIGDIYSLIEYLNYMIEQFVLMVNYFSEAELAALQNIFNASSTSGNLPPFRVPNYDDVDGYEPELVIDSVGDYLSWHSQVSQIQHLELDAIKDTTAANTKQLRELNSQMTEYINQSNEDTKNSFVDQAEQGLNENFDKIMDQLDIVDTSPIQDTFSYVYDAIDNDSMRPVLHVSELNIPVLGTNYKLWDSFDIDIVSICEQMGFDQYLFWFRFTFYFGVALFFYNRFTRVLNIILLDDVREETAQARVEAREYRNSKRGK